MSDNKQENKIGIWQTLIPVTIGIVAVDLIPVDSEILRWILSAIITVIAFAICLMISNK